MILNRVQGNMWNNYKEEWFQVVHRDSSLKGQGRNKLRTYRSFMI